MRRRDLVLLALAVALVVLWAPVLSPGGKAALVLLDIYSQGLVGTNVAALITPEPRHALTRERFGGTEMRVDWWRPGWGDRHPAIMLVNGATPLGNENSATQGFGVTLARAGYLVMLPEFPFSKEGRLDPDAPRVVDAAFAHLRGLPETAGRPAGAFGASTGAGLMLSAAGTYPALRMADHLTVLGGYFDLHTYVAAVAARSLSDGSPWQPSDEAKERIPPAVEAAMTEEADRAKVRQVFAVTTYASALDALAHLSPKGREVLDRLSPSTAWSAVAPPVFWIHDPNDSYEPLAEAYAAQAAPRPGRFVLVVPRLVQHAEAGNVQGQDALFVARELAALLAFTLEVLRVAG
jgi:hypothetical protein